MSRIRRRMRGVTLGLTLLALAGAALPAQAARTVGVGGSPELQGVPGVAKEKLTAPQEAWQDQIIYMVMTDRFADGDKSNDALVNPDDPSAYHGGDLQGLQERLPDLKQLGVTAIWITPVVKNQAKGYHGYWATDLTQVDPHLGDWQKLHEFTDAAHAQGMKVLLDAVVNHTGQQHPWVADAAHKGWFHPATAIDFSSQSSIENGWLAGLPDWNTENPQVQQYLIEMSKLWLEKSGADGFRMDTARHVPKAFWQETYVPAIKQAYPNFWMVGEVWDTSHYDYLGGYQKAGIDAVFDFPLYAAIGKVFGHDGAIGLLTGDQNLANTFTPRPTQLVSFIDNHDVSRFVTDAAEPRIPRLEEALTFLLTYRDIPMLYYGTEIGLEGGKDPDNRRDMPWRADGTPAQHPEVYSLTQKLIALRTQHVALRRGSYTELLEDGKSLAFSREFDPAHPDALTTSAAATSGARDVVITVLNNQDAPLTKPVPVAGLATGALPDGTVLQDALTGRRAQVRDGAFVPGTPARTGQVWVIAPTGLAAALDTLGRGGLLGILGGVVMLGLLGWFWLRGNRRQGGAWSPRRPEDRR